MEQIKEALLRKHTELIERAKKTATQFAITTELAKVLSLPDFLLEETAGQLKDSFFVYDANCSL